MINIDNDRKARPDKSTYKKNLKRTQYTRYKIGSKTYESATVAANVYGVCRRTIAKWASSRKIVQGERCYKIIEVVD